MIRDEVTGWVEPTFTVNGVTLSFAEAMTVRVAVSSFAMSVNDPETARLLGPVAAHYAVHLARILRLMLSAGDTQ